MKKLAGVFLAAVLLTVLGTVPAAASGLEPEAQFGSEIQTRNLHRGWYETGNSRYYYDRNGRYVTGKQHINHKLYYFRKDGKLISQKGAGALKERGEQVRYYWNGDGSLAENTWVKDDVYWCYAGEGGAFYTGKQFINGKEYHFSPEGHSKGYWSQSGSTWYYHDDRGKAKAYREKNTSEHAAFKHLNKKSLDSMRLGNTPNLMITAHADDELLWGGEELLKDKYLVVVITGADAIRRGGPRRMELQRVTELTGDKSIIMYYPDSYTDPYMIDDWLSCGNEIYKDLQTLIGYKNWNKIVTHNPQGEYGHIHHKMTNQKVTNICKRSNHFSKLYYFGHWYKRQGLEAHKSSMHRADKNTFQKLKKISKSYIGQFSTVEKLSYMMEYQSWIKAEQWH